MKLHQSEVWLREQYVVERRSCRDIAEELGVSHTMIYGYLKKFNIPTRSRIESVSKVKKLVKKKTQTSQEYVEKLAELKKLIGEVVELRELQKALKGEESEFHVSESEAEQNRLASHGKIRKKEREELKRRLELEKEGDDSWHTGDVDDQLHALQERYGGKI